MKLIYMVYITQKLEISFEKVNRKCAFFPLDIVHKYNLCHNPTVTPKKNVFFRASKCILN
jgi:hypothetical protein